MLCAMSLSHRRTNTREYEIWCGIKKRCNNPRATNYQWYGGRGITVCDRWQHDFMAFFSDMGPRPTPQHTIERIDNNGAYEPSNCRWATMQEQINNRRLSPRSHILAWNGEAKTVSEWARQLSVAPQAVTQRLKLGWTIEQALSKPRRRYPLHQVRTK